MNEVDDHLVINFVCVDVRVCDEPTFAAEALLVFAGFVDEVAFVLPNSIPNVGTDVP